MNKNNAKRALAIGSVLSLLWLNVLAAPPVDEIASDGLLVDTPISEAEGAENAQMPPVEGEPEMPQLPDEDAVVFSDVPAGIWYEEYVYALSAQGVVAGYPDGTFRPAQAVTVGEALKLTLLSAGYPEQDTPSGPDWSAPYQELAVTLSVIEEGQFAEMNVPIARMEVAHMLARALGLDPMSAAEARGDGDDTPIFADTDDGYVHSLYYYGIIEGSVDETGATVFLPDDSLTRSEVCAILQRVDGAPLPPPPTLLFGSHVLDVFSDIPAAVYEPDGFSIDPDSGFMTYADARFDTRLGIDVAYYQGDIDWQAVADDGVEFAIIRVGGRGYTLGNLYDDVQFEQNMQGAIDAGLDVGVYMFSQAISVDEARAEAEYVLSRVQGYDVNYPIVWDWEVIGGGDGRADNLDADTLGQAAAAFCDTIAAAGYTPMIYFNSYVGYLSYDLRDIVDYDWWYAGYSDHPLFYYHFDMWQYTSSGSVDGINGRVDVNLHFVPIE